MPALRLITRADCGLCEDMLADLQRLQPPLDLAGIQIQDVDSDPQLQRRYGLLVPVLLLDGSPVCHGHLDAAELRRLLRQR
ncbi:MAG: glutaredoxin family protein [Steroidobacteraceae bacterium]